jgi:hypothetical protein
MKAIAAIATWPLGSHSSGIARRREKRPKLATAYRPWLAEVLHQRSQAAAAMDSIVLEAFAIAA